jgi:signal recognition particle subunit SRP54
MLDALTQRFSSVVKTLRGHSRITEDNVQDMVREVRLALLDADAGLPVVKDFVARVREKAMGQEVIGSLTPGQALVGIVHQELANLMGGANAALSFAAQPPAVILLAGLQGSGKTTSAGKLARLIGNTTKKKVLLVSTDVYRPAAIDQLATLAKTLGVEMYPSDPSQKPVDIARAGARPREAAFLRRAHRRYRGAARDRRSDDERGEGAARGAGPDRDALRRGLDAGAGCR